MELKTWQEVVEDIRETIKRTGGKIFLADREAVEDEDYPEYGIREARSLEFEVDEETQDIVIYGEIRSHSPWDNGQWYYDEIASKDFPIYKGEYENGWFETFEEAWQAIKDKIDDEINYEETVKYAWEHR